MIRRILGVIGMVFCGMAGGQGRLPGGKAWRRFGLPAIAAFVTRRWQFLLLIPILCLGYGVDSQLGAICGHIEWLIRLVYAVLLSLPFLFFGRVRWIIACIALVAAFQVRAGSLWQISWFGDILIEDIVRYGTLASLVVILPYNTK